MNESLKLLERHSTPAKALARTRRPTRDKQLRQILKVALSAPDHGRLHPYRFISIRGDARFTSCQKFSASATLQRDPDVEPAYLAQTKRKTVALTA